MGRNEGPTGRLIRLWLSLTGMIVPRERRHAWVEEWSAELGHAIQGATTLRARTLVVLRGSGALRDAIQLRRLAQRAQGRRASMLGRLAGEAGAAAKDIVRSPGFPLFTVAVLALAIGINTAVLSMARSALFGEMQVVDAERVVQIWERRPFQGRDKTIASLPDFTDWRAQSTVFEAMAAMRNVEGNASGGDRPLPVNGATVSIDFQAVTGVDAALGRHFAPEDMTPPGEPVVILSDALWSDLYGRDPNVLGRTLDLDLEPHTVVGVMPLGFSFPYDSRFWLPLGDDPTTASRGSHRYDVVGRMKPDVTVDRAWADLDVVARRLESEYPETNTGHYSEVVPLRHELLGATRQALFLLVAAVGFVLLIVCVNVANMQLARSARRTRELAIRATMGASRHHLVRHVVFESLFMAAGAAAAALAVARVTHGLLARTAAAGVPWAPDIGLDGATIGIAVVLAMGAILLVGLGPAIRATRVDLATPIREGSQRSGLSRSTRRTQGGLVVAQVALAMVLLVGAGLFARTMLDLLATDVGYETENIVTAEVSLPAARYAETRDRVGFYRELEERLSRAPGVRRAAIAWILPLSGRNVGRNFLIEGAAPPPDPDDWNLRLRAVTPPYFEVLQIPLVRGRSFDGTDNEEAPLVAVASETLAQRHWPDGNPVGARIAWGEGAPWITIVGVVGEVLHDGPAYPPDPELYLPLPQAPPNGASVVVETGASLDAASATIVEAIRAVDPEQAVARIRRFDDTRADWLRQRRELAGLVGVFASVALLLASLGLYAVVTYAMQQRTREFGLRVALGGRPTTVLGEAMANGLRVVAAGLVIGLGLALSLSSLVDGLLVDIGPRDPTSVTAAALVLAAISLVAIYLPARRATRVNPMTCLNAE